MKVIDSVVLTSRDVTGRLVDRDITIEVSGFGVQQARAWALEQMSREYPLAKSDVLAHKVVRIPSSGATWSRPGVYLVTLRVRGMFEEDS